MLEKEPSLGYRKWVEISAMGRIVKNMFSPLKVNPIDYKLLISSLFFNNSFSIFHFPNSSCDLDSYRCCMCNLLWFVLQAEKIVHASH